MLGRFASRGTLIVLLSAPLVGNCGGSTHDGGGTPGVAGTSSMSGAGASLPTAGSAPMSGPNSGGGAPAGAAGSNRGGTSSPGGSASAGGISGSASGSGGAFVGDSGATNGGELGAGGDRSGSIGWSCGSDVCEPGQACVRCSVQGQSQEFCVPHPDQDPSGYANAIAKCQAAPNSYDDCDGPEDCDAAQHCVARTSPDGFIRCRNEPSTKNFCCFYCDSLPDCTLCRTNADCAQGESCEPTELPHSRGCARLR